MKRTAIALTAGVALALTACGSESAPTPPEPTPATSTTAEGYMPLKDQLRGAYKHCRILGAGAIDNSQREGDLERRAHYELTLDAPFDLDVADSKGPSYGINDPFIGIFPDLDYRGQMPANWKDERIRNGTFVKKMSAAENEAPKIVEASVNLRVLGQQERKGEEIAEVYVTASGEDIIDGAKQVWSGVHYCGNLSIKGDNTGIKSVTPVEPIQPIESVQLLPRNVY